MDFKDILAQKIQKLSSLKEEPTEAKIASSFDLMHLEPEFTLKPLLFHSKEIPYESRSINTELPTPKVVKEEVITEPLIEVKNLDSAGQFSLEIFMKLGGIELKKERFSPRELKKCFRKLAKLHHPDLAKQGKSEQFQQLKMAYDTLKDAA